MGVDHAEKHHLLVGRLPVGRRSSQMRRRHPRTRWQDWIGVRHVLLLSRRQGLNSGLDWRGVSPNRASKVRRVRTVAILAMIAACVSADPALAPAVVST